jgi:uncharacterized iron-regulated membrane protein
MTPQTSSAATAAEAVRADSSRSAKFYRAAWRWHFYAGIYVIPFFIILACTGMAMMWIAFMDGRDGERTKVPAQEIVLPVSEQARAALAVYPEGNIEQYVAPHRADLASLFRIDTADGAMMVVLDPYTAEVVETFPRRSGIYELMDEIHGTLMLGVTGDRMIETAASLAIILIITGVFMWWPRSTGAGSGSAKKMLMPNLKAKGRSLWKNLHSVVGTWTAAMLLLFLLSGLAWSGIWGSKFVQPWSSFPADKSAGAHASDTSQAELVTHGDVINNGSKEVPWVLEQTPMPVSGTVFGVDGLAAGTPVTMDVVDAFAREIGYDGRYHLILPQGETGVWSLTRSSMSSDASSPFIDRTVHIDQYSGKILADVGFEDYGWMGKAMAAGIAFHMGTIGLPFVLLNTVFCLSVIFLCVSGAIMRWKRRPAGQKGLVPPPAPRDMPLWKGAVAVALVVSMAFPLAGLTLIFVLVLDCLILSPLMRRTRLAA